jgi:hypothetical protein
MTMFLAGAARLLVLASVLLLTASGAAAGNPLQLRCPSMPSERSLPRPLGSAALGFFPWVRPVEGLRAGPVDLVALSFRTAISRDGDELDGAGYYLHRALVAVTPFYSCTVLLRGRRLGHPGRRTALGFSTNGATACAVDPPVVSCGTRLLRFTRTLRIVPRRGWRIVPTELRIGRTGCFRITATGRALHATIPLAVPGPDDGTPGW